ncbi:Flp pilus assembly complex ATPase component TadA [Candidatus Saccharibacteria bacterium]|nr:Flp pilus assembly complex ATPase component TadA [Candidatus Saccharibacteria bacterium]MCL1963283.1 Flp pilus assembly complex ATPase component TadA [Candidatus Saccharibacteria bacterium]
MSILTEELQQKVGQHLVETGVLSLDQLNNLSEQAHAEGKPVFAYMIETGALTDEQLTEADAHASGVPYVDLSRAVIDSKILALLSVDVAQRFMAVPLGETDDAGAKRLAVAMLDASNVQAVDFLANAVGRPIKVYMASETGINNVLSQYHLEAEQFDNSIGGVVEDTTGTKKDSVKIITQDSPVSKILTQILEYAQRSRSSDVHIEPLETEVKIRCRIDGVLRQVMQLPKSVEAALISRIKILSTLKIDEHRKPQDGQFTVMVGDKEVDLRISISPVVWGEQVVIRLLDKSGSSFKLEEMGYAGRALRMIRKGIVKPNGMILTSGPTGSGKSTSLYALIKEIFSDEINIVTLEDPVEYKMPGVNQIQVNPDVGLTFASGLRSILRQDPDVVMVGEIRDGETANLAVQAALTGHLVFSTLHTNSAAGILPRLIDMGIEPFLIASTINTVIGQRLVRRVATERDTYQSNEMETQNIKETAGYILPTDPSQVASYSEDLGYKDLPLANAPSYTLVRGQDSPTTPGGYKGRLGLYEVMDITEEIQQLIIKHATSGQIQRVAIAQGMIPMHVDGYLKALNGLTTLEEVNRVAMNMA